MPSRLLVARPAGVGDDHGHITEVRPVAHRGLYADLRGDAADGERHKPQVAHGHTEEGALEGTHGDLVGDRLAGQWRELRHYLRLGRPRREGGHDVLEPVRTLPGHLLPELGEAHEFFGQRDVSAEEHRETPLARRAEHLGDLAGDLGAVGQLARYAGLHVVDQQRHTPRVANVLQRTRYPRPEDAVLHRILLLRSCRSNPLDLLAGGTPASAAPNPSPNGPTLHQTDDAVNHPEGNRGWCRRREPARRSRAEASPRHSRIPTTRLLRPCVVAGSRAGPRRSEPIRWPKGLRKKGKACYREFRRIPF